MVTLNTAYATRDDQGNQETVNSEKFSTETSELDVKWKIESPGEVIFISNLESLALETLTLVQSRSIN